MAAGTSGAGAASYFGKARLGVGMRRLATLIVIGCVLVGGCDRRCVGPECTNLDYADFLRFGGITYNAGDSNLDGRRPRRSDLGPVFALVRRNPPADDLNYRMADGDAAFVAAGAPVYTVKGYRPRFRLAANHGGRLWFYEAREVPGAQRSRRVGSGRQGSLHRRQQRLRWHDRASRDQAAQAGHHPRPGGAQGARPAKSGERR